MSRRRWRAGSRRSRANAHSWPRRRRPPHIESGRTATGRRWDLRPAQTFETAAAHRPIWVFRRDLPEVSLGTPIDRDTSALLSAAEAWSPPEGEGYAWIAAEAGVARTLRDHMLEERGHPKAWLKAAGYWVAGAAGASDEMDH